MLRKLSAIFVFSAMTGTVAFAQQIPARPPSPESLQRIERQMQIFNDGGSYLGVHMQEVSKENISKFGLREVRGVAVERVVENSPAAQAGLQKGDVIVRFNGEEITSVRKLTRLIGEVAPDHQARITVLRGGGGGNERELTATMGKRPAAQFQNGTFRTEDFSLPGIPEFPSQTMPRVTLPPGQIMPVPPMGNNQDFLMFRGGRQIGVQIMPLVPQLGDYFGVAGGKGLLVSSVRANSAAAKAGLKAGDIIVEVDGKAVSGTFDLMRAINEKAEGDVTLTVVRNRNRQTIKVTPEKMNGSEPFLMEYFNSDENGNKLQPAPRPNPRVAPRVLPLNRARVPNSPMVL